MSRTYRKRENPNDNYFDDWFQFVNKKRDLVRDGSINFVGTKDLWDKPVCNKPIQHGHLLHNGNGRKYQRIRERLNLKHELRTQIDELE